MELKTIGDVLLNEGFKVTPGSVIMNGTEVPTLRVVIELGDGGKGQELDMELLFVPNIDQELAGCKLLQLFIVLPEVINEEEPDKLEHLSELLSEMNFNLPIGAFGIRSPDGMLFYKHMMMMPPVLDENTSRSLSEAVWLIAFVQNQCYPSIAVVFEA